MDLSCRYRKLPAELNRQIFLCFNPAFQRKFIWGLGWDFYAMFRYRLLIKTKRVRNPSRNCLSRTNTTAIVATDGLHLHVSKKLGVTNVYAEQPFPTSGPHCRVDEFPGTICYYYEVKGLSYFTNFGLSDGAIPDNHNLGIGFYSNSYAIKLFDECWLAGEFHHWELPEGAIRPRPEEDETDVYGCGLVLNPENKLSIFFTLNGKLMGRKIPISPTVDRLFPTVLLFGSDAIVEANFGDNPAKPFVYDLENCQGLELACV